MEPLAILLRSSPLVPGPSVGPLREIISLYADDTLLYLPDASASLDVALAIIDRFRVFSGIKINWSKSLFFPLSPYPPLPHPSPLSWVFKFRYLGVEIQYSLSAYLTDNAYPILHQLTLKCQTWKSLPLSLVGRIKLLKMTFLPKFLCLS